MGKVRGGRRKGMDLRSQISNTEFKQPFALHHMLPNRPLTVQTFVQLQHIDSRVAVRLIICAYELSEDGGDKFYSWEL